MDATVIVVGIVICNGISAGFEEVDAIVIVVVDGIVCDGVATGIFEVDAKNIV